MRHIADIPSSQHPRSGRRSEQTATEIHLITVDCPYSVRCADALIAALARSIFTGKFLELPHQRLPPKILPQSMPNPHVTASLIPCTNIDALEPCHGMIDSLVDLIEHLQEHLAERTKPGPHTGENLRMQKWSHMAIGNRLKQRSFATETGPGP